MNSFIGIQQEEGHRQGSNNDNHKDTDDNSKNPKNKNQVPLQGFHMQYVFR